MIQQLRAFFFAKRALEERRDEVCVRMSADACAV
jgi:hypothetical protein